MSRRRRLRIALAVLGGGAALGLLWLLYRDLDLRRLRDALSSAQPMWLAALVAATLAENWLRGWKWGQILHDLKPIAATRLFGAIMAGYAANLVAPFGVSPFVRSWLVARLEELAFATVLVTAGIARFVDGLAFATLALVTALAVTEYVAGLKLGLAVGGLGHAAAFGGVLWLLFRSRSGLQHDAGRLGRWIDAVAARGGKRMAGLRLALSQGIVWPRARLRQLGILGASLLVKLLAVVQILCAGLAFGVSLAPVDAALVTVTAGLGQILGRLIRIPGGFTIGAGLALHLAGVAEAEALALILVRNALTIGLNVICGLGFLAWNGIDPRKAPRLAPGGQS